MKMYEICEAMTALLDPETGDITDMAAFEALCLAYDEKVLNLGRLAKNIRSEMDALKQQSDDFARRYRSKEAQLASLTEYIGRLTDGHEYKADDMSVIIKTVKNGGLKPIVFSLPDVTPDSVDERFQKRTIDFDKTAIRMALDSGEQLDWACYGERGTHLVIK